MLCFRFLINLSEEDYIAFNSFHAFCSPLGKKNLRKMRITIILLGIFLSVALLTWQGLTLPTACGILAAGLYTLFYLLFYKKIILRNLKKSIENMKKTGKLPYDPVATLELYEDKLVEITPTSRTEYRYEAFERICVVSEKFILLYRSSANAYIFPIDQIRAQANQDVFLGFLYQKCPTIEYYENPEE